MDRGRNPFNGRPSFYGRGWGVGFDSNGDVILNHAGAFSLGARTVVTLYPAQKLGIVVLTNAFPTGVPDALADSLFDLVRNGELTQDWFSNWNGLYEGLGEAFGASGIPYETPPVDATPALATSAYTGVYATRLRVRGKSHPSVTNVGFRPTFELQSGIRIETHILDFQGDILGEKVRLEFVRFLREEMKFSGVDELKAQIEKDIAEAREALRQNTEHR